MTTQGEDVLAWLESAITTREATAFDAKHVSTNVSFFWTESEAYAQHVSAGGPNDVLRRCTADRKLLALHRPVEMVEEMADACSTCEVAGSYPYYPCATLLALAEGYGWTEAQR